MVPQFRLLPPSEVPADLRPGSWSVAAGRRLRAGALFARGACGQSNLVVGIDHFWVYGVDEQTPEGLQVHHFVVGICGSLVQVYEKQAGLILERFHDFLQRMVTKEKRRLRVQRARDALELHKQSVAVGSTSP